MDYNKLLEKARKVYDECVTNAEKRKLESVFPELAESEDEKIRKELIELIGCMHNADTRKVRWLAWLEKQDQNKFEEELEKAYKCADKAQYRKGYEDAKCEIEKQGEQKLAWSEEDEGELYLTISLLDEFKKEAYTNDCENCIHWLKSLKPQPRWKPTDEQMEALDKVYKTHGADCECRHIILGLLNELKKL